MLYAFLVATVLIALAELGDKTQLLALMLACRYRPWQVLVGIFGATLLIHLLSTAIGAAVGSFIPVTALTWIAGVLFVSFGVWTLRGDSAEDEEASKASRFGPVMASAIAFFLAEIGDKTQLMTMAIAADPGAALRTFGGFAARWLPASSSASTSRIAGLFGVWMGSTLGMVIADGIAILVGAGLGKALPAKAIGRVSGTLFIVFGVGMIVAMYVR